MEPLLRTCSTCVHELLMAGDDPCRTCHGHAAWKPVEVVPFKGLETAYDEPRVKPESPEQLTPAQYIETLRPEPSALDVQVSGTHYKNLAIQPIEYIHANNIPFAEGSVIKYVSRWRNKNGIKDLEKAKHFIELLIELETKKEQGETT